MALAIAGAQYVAASPAALLNDERHSHVLPPDFSFLGDAVSYALQELDEPIVDMTQLPLTDKRGMRRSVSVGGARLAETRPGGAIEAAAAAATAAAAAAGFLAEGGDAGRGRDGRPSRIGIRRMDTTTASAGGGTGSQQLLHQHHQHLEPVVAKAMLNSQRFTSPHNERMVRRNGPAPGVAAVNQQQQGPGARPPSRPFTSLPPSPAGKFPLGNPTARSGRGPVSAAAGPSAAPSLAPTSRTYEDSSLGVSPTSQQSVAVPSTASPIAPSRIKVVVRPYLSRTSRCSFLLQGAGACLDMQLHCQSR